MIRSKIKYLLAAVAFLGVCSCENGDAEFPDYQGGTSVYFPYQYPVRTIVLGDDDYDVTLDHAHKCQIRATFGGSQSGSNGSVQIMVDNSLVNNLTFADGSPVKAMPESYYTLSTTTLSFGGTYYGTAEVQLTDAFFNDPATVNVTYVIPVVMVGQTGFGRILSGTLIEGADPIRTDESAWEVKPMDYMLYCVKYQNKYSGVWLTNGTTDITNIEKGRTVAITTKTLDSSIYGMSFQNGNKTYDVELLLTFDANEQCTFSISKCIQNETVTNADGSSEVVATDITSLASVSGNGSWGDDTEKKAWGNKDRDGMALNYTINFGDGFSKSVNEKLVWQRSDVTRQEFTPTYVK